MIFLKPIYQRCLVDFDLVISALALKQGNSKIINWLVQFQDFLCVFVCVCVCPFSMNERFLIFIMKIIFHSLHVLLHLSPTAVDRFPPSPSLLHVLDSYINHLHLLL